MLVDITDRIMTIVINRPEARNTVTMAVSVACSEALDELDELDALDDLAVGVITGADGNFCAGMDLKGFLRGERPSLPGRGFAGLTRPLQQAAATTRIGQAPFITDKEKMSRPDVPNCPGFSGGHDGSSVSRLTKGSRTRDAWRAQLQPPVACASYRTDRLSHRLVGGMRRRG
ncbi:hypothetical protein AQJ46_45420 [Streptomyces canus]|uniref:Enoyl-CoA hydratase n=1 Tax=Streptomyces canus TaxID=58343 RepID=A0A101RLU3_9ACTN|nr:hypothetical protein AQJ46_45420 [Streptomyces canus]